MGKNSSIHMGLEMVGMLRKEAGAPYFHCGSSAKEKSQIQWN